MNTTPIPVPPRAAQQMEAIAAQRQAIEETLKNAINLLSAALGVPDGWQLQVTPDGSMLFVAPAGVDPLPA